MALRNFTANQRMALVAFIILFFDQLTKLIVLSYLGYAQERVVVDGFFKFVHWGNTGAAWSMFHGNNEFLAIISLIALLVLFFTRHHFDTHRFLGQLALGLMFGGIMGNLTDRMMESRRHVIDFIYFYMYRRSGEEIGFPAFNIADAAICTGVGLLFLLSWQGDSSRAGAGAATAAERPQS